jgi:hypothetical protein
MLKPVETDPNGIDAKTPGAKLDAGKSPIVQGALAYFPRAIMAVANLSQVGAQKYSWKGWETVDDGENRYNNAMGRHIVYEEIEGIWDDGPGGSGELHATAIAWNALARLELVLRRLEQEEQASEESSAKRIDAA